MPAGSASQAGSRSMTRASVSATVCVAKAPRPLSISYSTQPSAQMSARASTDSHGPVPVPCRRPFPGSSSARWREPPRSATPRGSRMIPTGAPRTCRARSPGPSPHRRGVSSRSRASDLGGRSPGRAPPRALRRFVLRLTGRASAERGPGRFARPRSRPRPAPSRARARPRMLRSRGSVRCCCDSTRPVASPHARSGPASQCLPQTPLAVS